MVLQGGIKDHVYNFQNSTVQGKEKNISSCENLMCHKFTRQNQNKSVICLFFQYLQKLENKTWLNCQSLLLKSHEYRVFALQLKLSATSFLKRIRSQIAMECFTESVKKQY